MRPAEPVTGLILSGGGARAAYQVGVLAAIAELLPVSSVMRSDLKRDMILSVMSWLFATTRNAGAMFNPTAILPCVHWRDAARPAGQSPRQQ